MFRIAYPLICDLNSFLSVPLKAGSNQNTNLIYLYLGIIPDQPMFEQACTYWVLCVFIVSFIWASEHSVDIVVILSS